MSPEYACQTRSLDSVDCGSGLSGAAPVEVLPCECTTCTMLAIRKKICKFWCIAFHVRRVETVVYGGENMFEKSWKGYSWSQ